MFYVKGTSAFDYITHAGLNDLLELLGVCERKADKLSGGDVGARARLREVLQRDPLARLVHCPVALRGQRS